MSDLHSANLRALLCGWLPWLFELHQLSSADLERFETDCSALSRRIASDCMRALVGLHVWLFPSECNRCAQRKSVDQLRCWKGKSTTVLSVLTLRLVLWPSLPFTSFFSSNSLDLWLSSVSHDEYWLLVSIASAEGDGIVSFFITSAFFFVNSFLNLFPNSFLVRSHVTSQPNHRSASLENIYDIFLSSAKEFTSDLRREKREREPFIRVFN